MSDYKYWGKKPYLISAQHTSLLSSFSICFIRKYKHRQIHKPLRQRYHKHHCRKQIHLVQITAFCCLLQGWVTMCAASTVAMGCAIGRRMITHGRSMQGGTQSATTSCSKRGRNLLTRYVVLYQLAVHPLYIVMLLMSNQNISSFLCMPIWYVFELVLILLSVC